MCDAVLERQECLTDGGRRSSCVQSNSSLLSLSLSGNRFGDRGGVSMSRMLQVNSTLQMLQLSDCNLVTAQMQPSAADSSVMSFLLPPQADRSVAALGAALNRNTALQALDISRPLLFSRQVQTLASEHQCLAEVRTFMGDPPSIRRSGRCTSPRC